MGEFLYRQLSNRLGMGHRPYDPSLMRLFDVYLKEEKAKKELDGLKGEYPDLIPIGYQSRALDRLRKDLKKYDPAYDPQHSVCLKGNDVVVYTMVNVKEKAEKCSRLKGYAAACVCLAAIAAIYGAQIMYYTHREKGRPYPPELIKTHEGSQKQNAPLKAPRFYGN